MDGTRTTTAIDMPRVDDVTVQVAAQRAVDAVFVDSDNEGLPKEQVMAIANATKEVLVRDPGYDERAKRDLAAAFQREEVDELFEEIEKAAA